ncbi:MAG: hypothetical protein RL033_1217 [Pseudomonadota bacterium]|jgi:glutathione S-transferase
MHTANVEKPLPNSAPLTLYSTQACPFAQRTRLVLREKGLPYQLIEVDLAQKPAKLAEISLYDRVPVLEHEGRHLCESNAINEYLEEVFPAPALLPDTPHARGRARVWMDFANTSLFDTFKRVHISATAAERAQAWNELEVALARLEGEARRAMVGPYWFGAQPSLVDFTLYPVFEHWGALVQHGMPALPASLTWLHRWLAALSQQASVRATANTPELYGQRYARSLALPSSSQRQVAAVGARLDGAR